ncbi:MAG: type II toxin-antitoxin system HicA family toxin, partial [Rhodospirillaceae bacterium]|nr:type II toxin-antitoxin system HicA family toxin [Rhodospirillaceae bacterium]
MQFHYLSLPAIAIHLQVLYLVPQWYYPGMPPKIRELMRELSAAGFEKRGGKGSHRNFRHPKGVIITISG